MEHEKTIYCGALISGGRTHGISGSDEGNRMANDAITEANYNINLPSTIYIDNQSAMKMSANMSEHDRSKHIRIRYNYIKEEIDTNQTRLKWISSGEQLADIFTKALQGLLSSVYATKSSQKSLKHHSNDTTHTKQT